MTPNPAARRALDPGGTEVRPLLDVMAVLAAKQQQLDDLTDALETQHRTLRRVLEQLPPTATIRHQDDHSPAAGQQP